MTLRVQQAALSSIVACAFVCGGAAAAPAQSTVKIEQKVPYLGTQNNIRLSNDTVELIIATDYGPRVMRFAPLGSTDEDNVFATIPGVTLKTDYGDWYIRGGHRMWHAPEDLPRSYEPDNDPVTATIDGNTIKLAQPVEKHTQILKEMWITLDPAGSHVTVEHRLTNKSPWPVDMACWAMSAMNKGGTAIIPQEPYQSHDAYLQPVRPVVMWAYTNLADPRWTFGQKFFTLHQDPNNKEAQKVGVMNRQGWAAFAHNGALFLKRFDFDASQTYPDYGCNNETFTNDAFLELETLGPIRHVLPGQMISHTENWWLFKKVDLGNGEAGIAAAMEPLLTQTKK